MVHRRCDDTRQEEGAAEPRATSVCHASAPRESHSARAPRRASAWFRGLPLVLALVQAAAAACGDGNLEPPNEECDDGNAIDHDGCSGQCKREEIAYQTWYESNDCTGKILKRVIFNDREYLRSKDARIDFRFGPPCLHRWSFPARTGVDQS
jgi:cysteine-rich repeat protein